MFFVYVKIVLTNQQEKENFGLFKMRRIYLNILNILKYKKVNIMNSPIFIRREREREREREAKCDKISTYKRRRKKFFVTHPLAALVFLFFILM